MIYYQYWFCFTPLVFPAIIPYLHFLVTCHRLSTVLALHSSACIFVIYWWWQPQVAETSEEAVSWPLAFTDKDLARAKCSQKNFGTC